MADPKFANLPGIAYDQPDVYETPDIAENETSDYYEEEPENELIERLHISTKNSYNKFKSKQLEGSVDFSDRISSKIRRGYDSWSNEYEIVGEGEKENPIQKCRRLQCEMNELLDEVSKLQVTKEIEKEEKESYEAVTIVIGTAKKVLDSLRLEQVLGKEQVSTASEKEVKNLISQVEDYKKSGILTAVQPSGTDLGSTTRIAKLEHRLHLLEKAIGAQPDKLSHLTAATGSINLLEAVRQLSTKAALLQPNELDKIESRLNNLGAKMDTIAEKSSGSTEDSRRDQQVIELYDMAKRSETIVEGLPDMLERMKALESLHNYAMNFAKIISEIEATQLSITHDLVNNKSLLASVQESFAENMDSISEKLNKLDARINSINLK